MEKRRILISDDSKLFLEMERGFLDRDSFELHTATTGRETLDTAVRIQPHLILQSFNMPDLPGDEICSAIKKDYGFSSTKVVLVTDENAEENLASCVDAGCDGIVTIPIDRDRLLETVQKLLGETLRRKPRYRVNLPCAVYLEREGIPGTMLDISEIGCRVTADDFLEKGTVVNLGFNLPETEQSVKWSGVLRWSVPHRSDASLSIIGVEFTDPPVRELEILQDILASMPDSSRL